ncbi:MAG: hypothetical protein HMLKMBBP_03816 [Planctomycetes bacterium]|nr:hypothetical protein [Planctomycetota bacterium]
MRPFTLVLLAAAACLTPAVDAAMTGPTLAEDAATVDPEMAALVRELGSAGTRVAAARKLVTAGEKAVPALVAVLKDDLLAEHALDVLAKLGPAAKGAVGALSPLVKQRNFAQRARVAYALGSIGAEAEPALTNLIDYLRESRASAGRDSAANAAAAIACDYSRRIRPPARPNDVDRSIDAGWDWLIRHQHPGGRWSAAKFSATCERVACSDPGMDEHDVGLTGLSILALLDVRGEQKVEGRRAEAILAAASWLVSRQDAEGFIGERGPESWIYGHLIATLALVQCRRRGLAIQDEPVARTVVATQTAQNPYLAWRYGIRDGDNDLSVTGWAVRALAAAAEAGLTFDPNALQGANTWRDRMTDATSGRVGYQTRGAGNMRPKATIDRFTTEGAEPMTAMGAAVAMDIRHAASFLRDSGAPKGFGLGADSRLLTKSVGLVLAAPPDRRTRPTAADLYYWMHGARLVRTYGWSSYSAWRDALVSSLVPYQSSAEDSCSRGSWDAFDPWGHFAGRVFSTSAAVISLCEMRDDPASLPPLTTIARRVISAFESGARDADPWVADRCSHLALVVRASCK